MSSRRYTKARRPSRYGPFKANATDAYSKAEVEKYLVLQLTQQLVIAKQKASVSEDELKRMKAELEAANQKQAVSEEELNRLRAESAAANQKQEGELNKVKAELAAAKSNENGFVKDKCFSVNNQAQGEGKDNKENKELRSEILSTIKTNNTVTMAGVGGMNDVKEALLEAIVLPKKSAQRPGLALLYGPSGTGKTHIVSAVAHRSKCTLFVVKASDIASKWHGQSEKKITLLFEEARKQHYSIIFIDELDCMFSNREQHTYEYGRRVLTSFLTEINRIGDDIHNVAVLAATNKPWDLDRAVQDRFDTKIYVPLPDLETRQSILKLQMKGRNHSLNGDDFKRLARLTEGATAREVGSLAKKACLGSMKCDNTYVIVDGKYKPTSCCVHCPPYQEGPKADNCRRCGVPKDNKCRRCGAIRISPYDIPDGSLECRSIQMNDFVKNLKSSYCSVTNEMRQRYEGWQGS